jgi:hypothetical protein
LRACTVLGHTSALIRGIFLKICMSNSSRTRYKVWKFGFDWPVINGTLLEARRALSAVSRLSLEGYFCTFILRTLHTCPTNTARLVAIGQQLRALYFRAMCFLGCSSASIGGILLKIRTSQCTRMRHEKCKFGCEWPIVKDTLFEKQCDFAVSRFPLEGFS